MKTDLMNSLKDIGKDEDQKSLKTKTKLGYAESYLIPISPTPFPKQ